METLDTMFFFKRPNTAIPILLLYILGISDNACRYI